jgi:hypothetical protein
LEILNKDSFSLAIVKRAQAVRHMLPIGTAVPSGYLPTDTVTQKAGKFQ